MDRTSQTSSVEKRQLDGPCYTIDEKDGQISNPVSTKVPDQELLTMEPHLTAKDGKPDNI